MEYEESAYLSVLGITWISDAYPIVYIIRAASTWGRLESKLWGVVLRISSVMHAGMIERGQNSKPQKIPCRISEP